MAELNGGFTGLLQEPPSIWSMSAGELTLIKPEFGQPGAFSSKYQEAFNAVGKSFQEVRRRDCRIGPMHQLDRGDRRLGPPDGLVREHPPDGRTEPARLRCFARRGVRCLRSRGRRCRRRRRPGRRSGLRPADHGLGPAASGRRDDAAAPRPAPPPPMAPVGGGFAFSPLLLALAGIAAAVLAVTLLGKKDDDEQSPD